MERLLRWLSQVGSAGAAVNAEEALHQRRLAELAVDAMARRHPVSPSV